MFLRIFSLVFLISLLTLHLNAQKNRKDFSIEKVLQDKDTLPTKSTQRVANNAPSPAAKAVEEAIKAYQQENAEGLKNKTVRKLRTQCEDALHLSEKEGNVALQLKILPYLKLLAEWKNETKEADAYAQKIRTLTAATKPVEIPVANYKPIPAEPVVTPKTVTPTPVAPAPTTTTPTTTTIITDNSAAEKIAAEKEKVEKEKNMLLDILKDHKATIENMNEAQAKNALLELQQKALVDSFSYLKVTDSLAIINKDLELKENKTKIEIQASQQRLLWTIAISVALVALGLFYRFRKEKNYSKVLAEKNAIIAKEKERSEELLLNILPVAVAEELKANGLATARHYENVTVLFTDFKGFTGIASQLTPQELVSDLDYCFRQFDTIVLKHGLEKIKTIGDAYMVASGIPDTSHDHAVRMIRAAKEMIAFTEEWKKTKMQEGKLCFEVRIGINTGPVVAGVVGSKKFAYDIWGNTVNIASRMESSGEVGKINISSTTYELVKHEFKCIHRGKITAKNKGEIDMYFVV